MPQVSHIPASCAGWLCQRPRGSQSGSASLRPALLCCLPSPGELYQPCWRTGLSCRRKQQPLLIRCLWPKVLPGAFGRGWFVEVEQLPQPLSDFPKLGLGRICMEVPSQQEPIAPCVHLGCFLCFTTSFNFPFSLWISNWPTCGHELYPLRAVSYKATGRAQQQLGLPHVPWCGSLKRITFRAVMGKGCSCLSSVPA